jgi:hypothetical protein
MYLEKLFLHFHLHLFHLLLLLQKLLYHRLFHLRHLQNNLLIQLQLLVN